MFWIATLEARQGGTSSEDRSTGKLRQNCGIKAAPRGRSPARMRPTRNEAEQSCLTPVKPRWLATINILLGIAQQRMHMASVGVRRVKHRGSKLRIKVFARPAAG